MKKKVNILLIIAVLGLWGTVSYRFFKNFFYKDAGVAVTANVQASKFSISARDTFMLRPLEHDPFLSSKGGGINRGSTHWVSVKKRMPKVNDVKKPVAPWPKISYYGFIKSEKNEELALIKIDDVLYKMHKKETKNSVTLKIIDKDSAGVVYKKELKFIEKS